MNVYRSIGGRANTSGVERIDRDGCMEVLEMGEAEVTPRGRMNWYNKATIDKRGPLPEDVYETEEDNSHGNDMRTEIDMRTRLPRKHQFSTEARLSEERGDPPKFQKSIGNKELAVGITKGMVLSPDDKRSLLDPDTGKKALDDMKGTLSETKKASSKIKMVKGSHKFAMATAFERIAKTITDEVLSNDDIIEISKAANVSIEDVLLLEKVAMKNANLTQTYSRIRRRRRRRTNPCDDANPGIKDNPLTPEVEKVGDEAEGEGELLQTCKEVGLLE